MSILNATPPVVGVDFKALQQQKVQNGFRARGFIDGDRWRNVWRNYCRVVGCSVGSSLVARRHFKNISYRLIVIGKLCVESARQRRAGLDRAIE